jgi:hypothetical protein
VETEHPGLLQQINRTGELTEETRQLLRALFENVKGAGG